MAGKKQRYTVKEVQEAIKGSGGFYTEIARRLKCHRGTVHNYVKRYPTLAAEIESEREELKDLAEVSLLNQIKQGNTTAIIFFLKTRAKERGYVERQEIAGINGPLGIEYVNDWRETTPGTG